MHCCRTRLYKAELAGARDMETGVEQEAKIGCHDKSLTATLVAAQAKARAIPNRTTSRKRRKADYIEFDSHLVRPKIRVCFHYQQEFLSCLLHILDGVHAT